MEARDPIERLREYAAQCCPEYEPYDSHMMHLADEIEAAYMKLPVDADGVPIRIGDVLEDAKFSRINLVVDGYTSELKDGEGPIHPTTTSQGNYESEWFREKEYRHVKPDTVESLLQDMVKDIAAEHVIYVRADKRGEFGARLRAIRDDYAERIRRAMDA